MLPFTDMAFIVSFLFVFAIVYGLLATARVMTQKNINIVIALVFAFFAASYAPFVSALEGIIPIVAILLVIVFILVVLKRLFWTEKKEERDALPIVVSLAAVLIVLWGFWDKVYAYFYRFGVDPMNILWIIGIIVIVLIFYAVYSHPGEKK